MRSISPVILAVVLAACTTRTTRELVEDEGKDIPVARLCEVMLSTQSCSDICGAPFDECSYNNAHFGQFNRFQNNFTRDKCPASESVGPTVHVQCQRYETDEEMKFDPFPDTSVEGRRPQRLLSLPPLHLEDASALGKWFASSAHLESAAVLAFEHMIVELEAHGAPAVLVQAARVARADEIRHAQVVGDLASRFGATAAEARMESTPVRALLDIAIENEVEGVVRETLGAALATWRANSAGDTGVREAMEAIAEDERTHAELSWRLGEWLYTRLSDDERALVRDARRAAIAELHATFSVDPADEVVAVAGVPRAADVQALLTELDARLWNEAGLARAA